MIARGKTRLLREQEAILGKNENDELSVESEQPTTFGHDGYYLLGTIR
jgi:hypothetical protein